jgi:hypothetical protein
MENAVRDREESPQRHKGRTKKRKNEESGEDFHHRAHRAHREEDGGNRFK